MVASFEVVEGEAPVVGLEGKVGVIITDGSEIANQACLESKKEDR